VAIVRFVRSFDRDRFECGKPELNEWLSTQAGQQERADNTRTFPAIQVDMIVGYYVTTTYRLSSTISPGVRRRSAQVSAPLPFCWLAWLSINSGSARALELDS
jgi:hypothetical protein